MLNLIGMKNDVITDEMTVEDIKELTAKRKIFNEGWWKGFAWASICLTTGYVLGTIYVEIKK